MSLLLLLLACGDKDSPDDTVILDDSDADSDTDSDSDSDSDADSDADTDPLRDLRTSLDNEPCDTQVGGLEDQAGAAR